MDAHRVNTIASQMPECIRRWFLDPAYAIPSVEHQDWDLVLAEWSIAPLLIEYVEESRNPIEKRYEAFSALVVLRESLARAKEVNTTKTLSEEIKRLVLSDRQFAEDVCNGWLGASEALEIEQILRDHDQRECGGG